ncbi:hypothetical protein [Streptomyces sp. TRM75563]|uniref:hypothetical protein n=1 Tax=Streptomyces sp. TRM75563 TaxID=2817418 RepID=UPI001F60B1F5|nr:hypothetical protein [Streptomyces sp. TRM75563]MCI4045451.1 hypothetical protein [Streptomyces sp. TRM75563]
MIPDAVVAIIAATIRDHPTNTPEEQGLRAVRDLRDAGWTIAAPDVIAAALRAA